VARRIAPKPPRTIGLDERPFGLQTKRWLGGKFVENSTKDGLVSGWTSFLRMHVQIGPLYSIGMSFFNTDVFAESSRRN